MCASPPHQAALRDNTIDLIHIPRLTTGAHKNAADIRLAVDAMEMLMTHPEVGGLSWSLVIPTTPRW